MKLLGVHFYYTVTHGQGGCLKSEEALCTTMSQPSFAYQLTVCTQPANISAKVDPAHSFGANPSPVFFIPSYPPFSFSPLSSCPPLSLSVGKLPPSPARRSKNAVSFPMGSGQSPAAKAFLYIFWGLGQWENHFLVRTTTLIWTKGELRGITSDYVM